MSCGKVQSDGRSWVRVEAHLKRSYDVDVSHGYCPACAETALREAMSTL
jgi:hypothetical protein